MHEWIHQYFLREVMPVLTPIGLDPSHPFPRLLNKSLNFAIELEGRDAFGRSSGIAIDAGAAHSAARHPSCPNIAGKPNCFIFLSSMPHAHIGELFSGMAIKGFYQFRLTRDSELTVRRRRAEKPARTAGKASCAIAEIRRCGAAEIADNCPEHMEEFMLGQFGLEKADVYRVEARSTWCG